MSGAPPLVSVVMAVYDGERFLAEAIESILAQSYRELELVIVDDGSHDRSWEIVQGFAARDPRVRALRNEQNLGTAATRNRGLAAIDPQAAYVAVMDADDVALPERLARQVAFLEAQPEHAAVGSHILVIDEQGRELGLRRYPVSAPEIERVIGRFNPIAHPAATIRRSALDAVGGYDPRYRRCQDYDLWLRIADRWPIANLDEPLLRYRISQGQAKQKHLRQSLRLTIDIQRKWLLHPRFRSAANLAYFAAEHALLLLPEPLVMGLFTRLTYAPRRS